MSTISRAIVVGVDGSDTAALAARKAAGLASSLGGELHVVCAFDGLETEVIQVGSDQIRLSTAGDAQFLADRIAEELRASHPGMAVTGSAVEGKPAEVLTRVAEQLDAELIVVGNKRVQGMGRIFGNIAGAVASHAPCDVYIAHTHARG